jgi:hypothetical protein
MLIYFILLLAIIFVMKNIYELHQFDHSSELIQLQNPNHVTIKELVLKRSPIVIHNLVGKYNDISSLTIDGLINNNPGYIINDNGKNISLSSFNDNESMYVLNNNDINDHIGLQNSLTDISKSFGDKLSCNITNELSILKGNHSISLEQNKHNCEYYTQLSGNTTFYLFNPKHKEDILNKENNEIKKWAFKINLKSGIILYIPPGWYYFFESEGETITNRTYSDNYFTWFYNYLR